MKRLFSVVLLVALVVGISLPVMAKTTTLEVWTQPGSSRDAVEKQIAALQTKFPGVKVNISSFEWSDLSQKLLVGLATNTVPDLVQIEITFLGSIRDQGGDLLENLAAAPYGAAKYQKDILPFKWAQGSTKNNRLIGFPIDLSPTVMFYRRSHFVDTGFDDRPEAITSLTSTWDKYIALAKKLTRDTNSDGNNDRFLLGDGTQLFQYGSQQTGLPAVDADNKVNVDSRPWIESLERAVAFRSAGYDGSQLIQWTWNDAWKQALINGQLATEFMGDWFASSLKEWAPGSKGDWGIAPMPSGVGVTGGGSFYAIPSAAANKNEAWTLLELMVTKGEPSISAYKGSWQWSVLDKPDEFFGGQVINRAFAEAATNTPIQWVHGLTRDINKVVYENAWRAMSKSMSAEAYLVDRATVLRGMVKDYQAQLDAKKK